MQAASSLLKSKGMKMVNNWLKHDMMKKQLKSLFSGTSLLVFLFAFYRIFTLETDLVGRVTATTWYSGLRVNVPANK